MQPEVCEPVLLCQSGHGHWVVVRVRPHSNQFRLVRSTETRLVQLQCLSIGFASLALFSWYCFHKSCIY